LEAIEREGETLRAQLGALRAQQDLTEAFARHYTDAATLLTRLQDRLEEIERTNDVQAKRQLIELLVAHIKVETVNRTPRKKQAAISITYTLAPQRAVEFNTVGCIALPWRFQAPARCAALP